jgi:UPF0176 protein
MTSGRYRIAALYKFAPIANPEQLQPQLKTLCSEHEIRGTLILAEEGINGTIAGHTSGIEHILKFIRAIEGFADIEVKESWSDEQPFFRMKVRHKPEIVTMGADNADPQQQVGQYVEPSDWNALISEPGVVLIDTRNHYESRIGTFEGSTLPDTDSFRDFPQWVKDNESALKGARKIAMFCTGGIRCERATAYMLNEGFEEVYHLHGGILKYLENVPKEKSKWNGECFVFDQRTSVKHGLVEGDWDICYACREPINDEHKSSEHYIKGESCPLCVDKTTEAQKRGFRERHNQVKYAVERDEQHIGVPLKRHQ